METTAIFLDSRGDEEKKEREVHSEKNHSIWFSKRKTAKAKAGLSGMLLFIVDDDPLYLKALAYSISNKLPNITIKTFLTGEACLQQMKQNPNVVILDYFLNSKVPYAWNGLNILKQIKKLNPKTKVIMLSGQDSLDVAVKCIDNGSFDYISKSETAFVKINNVLMNIIGDAKANAKGLKLYQVAGAIIIIVFILYILFVKK